MSKQVEEKSREIKEIKQQLAKDSEYISSILTLLHNNKGDPETREAEKLGDAFIELWKKTEAEQRENLNTWNSKGRIKLIPYVDIVEALTKELELIRKPYEEIKKQITNDKKET